MTLAHTHVNVDGLRSVGGQLAAVIALGISIGFVVVFATQIEHSRQRFLDEELDRKTYTTELMAAQLYGAVRWRKPDIIQKVFDTIEAHDSGGIDSAITIDRNGDTLLDYHEDADSFAHVEEHLRSHLAGSAGSGLHTSLGERSFTVIAPITSSDGSDRSGTLAIIWSLDYLIATSRLAVVKQSSIALVSLGIVLAAALLFIRQRISKPLAQITAATTAIASGDKKFSVPWKSRADEIGAMARALVTFQQNVTLIDRLTAEQQAQNQRLHQALEKEREYNALHREFVSMVSHEFRTPIAIIDGAAQRIDRRIGRDTPDDLRGRTGKIRAAAARMIELIDSTLSVSRLEAGGIELELADCDLGKLLTEVVTRQQEISKNHTIRLSIGKMPPSLSIDPRRVDQILTNLLSNAVKYSPQSPHIDVEAGMIDDLVVVAVRDHGLGIPKAEVPKLFQRFFRASTSTGIPGTGIGLHLVKHLVELHKGRLAVDSIEGEGTTFVVELPATQRVADTRSNGGKIFRPDTAPA
jgi:signal transduction histidine kinase